MKIKKDVFKVALLILSMSLFLTAYLPSDSLAGPPCRDSGWMTGGGSIFATDGGYATYGGQVGNDGRVTHGFVLHCYPRNSDNLQVVDHRINQSFHLESIESITCLDTSLIPNPPDANFDTLVGSGVGRCKQPDRICWAEWTFTDGGEPGGCVRDTAEISVYDSGGLVFTISGNVDCGNHQAHSK